MKTAIIGGIGSGKSFALNVAKSMGFETLSADEINAELLEDEDYVKTLSERFPFAVENGVVNKKKLAQVVFSNKIKLAELNAIAHPRILKKIAECEGDAVVKISQNKLCQRLEEDKKSALAKRAESVRGRRRQKRWEEEIRKRTQRGAIYACKKQIVFQMG